MSDVVLYAEDDDNDVFLLRHCWKRLQMTQTLDVVPTGEKAVEYLTHRPPPALVLLDLNMPGMGGMDVLRWVRAEPKLARLPVAILSSSNQQKDLAAAQALGADAYFVKPSNVRELLELLAAMRQRWLTSSVT